MPINPATEPPILALDAGNTRLKVGWFLGEGLVTETHAYESAGLVERLRRAAVSKKIRHVGVSTVLTHGHPFLTALQADFPAPVRLFDTQAPSFLTNRYETPETLGVDRWMAVHGARAVCPEGRLLVIDAGTAITYEYLSAANEYLGGGISPGLELRYRALHQFTARLPLLQPSDTLPPLVGRSTTGAIHSGVARGVVAEMQQTISNYRDLENTPLQVVLTGGAAHRFENLLKTPIFAESALVLKGIHALLRFHLYGQTPSPPRSAS